MRDLTEEELELAPDWAVKFDFFHGRLVLMSDAVEVTNQTSTFRFIDIPSGDYWVGSDGDYDLCTRLIIRKPFDITKHEFSDFKVLDAEVSVNKRKLRLNFDSLDFHYADLSKDDAIVIAKALGVTAKDLN